MKLFMKAVVFGMLINLVSVVAFAGQTSSSCFTATSKLTKSLETKVAKEKSKADKKSGSAS